MLYKALTIAFFLVAAVANGSEVTENNEKENTKNITETTPTNNEDGNNLPSSTPKDTERVTTPLFVVKGHEDKGKDFVPSPLLSTNKDSKNEKHALDNLQISDTHSDVYAGVRGEENHYKNNPDHEGYLQQQYYSLMEKIKSETEDKGSSKLPPDLYTNMRYLKLLEKYKSRSNHKDYHDDDGSKTSEKEYYKIIPSYYQAQQEGYNGHTADNHEHHTPEVHESHDHHHPHVTEQNDHHQSHIVAHHSLSEADGHYQPASVGHYQQGHYVKSLQDHRGAVDLYTKVEETSTDDGKSKNTQAYYTTSELPDIVLKFLKSYKPSTSEHNVGSTASTSGADYGKLFKDYKSSTHFYPKSTESSEVTQYNNDEHLTSIHKFQTEAGLSAAYTGPGLNSHYGDLTVHKPLKFETDVKSTTFTGDFGSSNGKLQSSPHPYPFQSPEILKTAGHVRVYDHGHYGKEGLKHEHHHHSDNGKAMGLLKKAVGMLAAFIPLGLFLAALPPTVLYINTTQPSLPSRQRSLDDESSEISDPIFELVERYGLESLDDRECENRLFCEMSRLGERPESNIIQKGFWDMAHNTSNEMAENLGLREIFKAIRTDSCSIYKCKERKKKKVEEEGGGGEEEEGYTQQSEPIDNR